MSQVNILSIQSSGRFEGSLTRRASRQLIEGLKNKEQCHLVERNLNKEIPFIDEQWIEANFTDSQERSSDQVEKLSFSNALVNEVKNADIIVIGAPIYNFGIPAVLKAWVDLVARARLTFKYTENGPVGLLNNKKVFLVVASGGVPIESKDDFNTQYMRKVLSFLGLDNVSVIDATKLNKKQAISI